MTASPRKVRKVRVPGLPLPGGLAAKAEDQLAALAEAALVDAAPVSVLLLRDGELPVGLLGLRVAPEARGVRVEALSDAAHPGTVPVQAAPFAEDWALEVSLDSAVWLGRREAFAHGPVAADVLAVPEAATLDGDALTAVVRLWRPAGAGHGTWWRDYGVSGTVAVASREVAVAPGEAAVGGGLVARGGRSDPLAALAQGQVKAYGSGGRRRVAVVGGGAAADARWPVRSR
ncbi:MAG: hypothetical protein R3F59_26410 [Myxococcota bacterium]